MIPESHYKLVESLLEGLKYENQNSDTDRDVQEPDEEDWLVPPNRKKDANQHEIGGEKEGKSLGPDQPRKPKGKPGGGQFARKGEGGGGTYVAKYGSLRSKYSLHVNKRIRGPKIALKNYKQQDAHSCGFVAALTVSRFLMPDTSARDVLAAVRPTKSGGVDGKSLAKALKKLGIKATYTDKLTVAKLRRLVEKGIPVLVTVYPEGWSSDHWTAVQGFDDERIYLTNYKSLPIKQFMEEWYTKGEGLVCEPLAQSSHPAKVSPSPFAHRRRRSR